MSEAPAEAGPAPDVTTAPDADPTATETGSAITEGVETGWYQDPNGPDWWPEGCPPMEEGYGASDGFSPEEAQDAWLHAHGHWDYERPADETPEESPRASSSWQTTSDAAPASRGGSTGIAGGATKSGGGGGGGGFSGGGGATKTSISLFGLTINTRFGGGTKTRNILSPQTTVGGGTRRRRTAARRIVRRRRNGVRWL